MPNFDLEKLSQSRISFISAFIFLFFILFFDVVEMVFEYLAVTAPINFFTGIIKTTAATLWFLYKGIKFDNPKTIVKMLASIVAEILPIDFLPEYTLGCALIIGDLWRSEGVFGDELQKINVPGLSEDQKKVDGITRVARVMAEKRSENKNQENNSVVRQKKSAYSGRFEQNDTVGEEIAG